MRHISNFGLFFPPDGYPIVNTFYWVIHLFPIDLNYHLYHKTNFHCLFYVFLDFLVCSIICLLMYLSLQQPLISQPSQRQKADWQMLGDRVAGRAGGRDDKGAEETLGGNRWRCSPSQHWWWVHRCASFIILYALCALYAVYSTSIKLCKKKRIYENKNGP